MSLCLCVFSETQKEKIICCDNCCRHLGAPISIYLCTHVYGSLTELMYSLLAALVCLCKRTAL